MAAGWFQKNKTTAVCFARLALLRNYFSSAGSKRARPADDELDTNGDGRKAIRTIIPAALQAVGRQLFSHASTNLLQV